MEAFYLLFWSTDIGHYPPQTEGSLLYPWRYSRKMLLKNEANLNLLNINSPTHFSTTSACLSAIDLTFCNQGIAQNISWSAISSLYDSDHFPIKITYHTNYSHNAYISTRWKLNKADWTAYREFVSNYISQCTESISIHPDSINTSLENFIRIITEAADLGKPLKTAKNSHG